jgi:hypothetical protein
MFIHVPLLCIVHLLYLPLLCVHLKTQVIGLESVRATTTKNCGHMTKVRCDSIAADAGFLLNSARLRRWLGDCLIRSIAALGCNL